MNLHLLHVKINIFHNNYNFVDKFNWDIMNPDNM